MTEDVILVLVRTVEVNCYATCRDSKVHSLQLTDRLQGSVRVDSILKLKVADSFDLILAHSVCGHVEKLHSGGYHRLVAKELERLDAHWTIKFEGERLRKFTELATDPPSAEVGSKHVVCVDRLRIVGGISRAYVRHVVVERHHAQSVVRLVPLVRLGRSIGVARVVLHWQGRCHRALLIFNAKLKLESRPMSIYY